MEHFIRTPPNRYLYPCRPLPPFNPRDIVVQNKQEDKEAVSFGMEGTTKQCQQVSFYTTNK